MDWDSYTVFSVLSGVTLIGVALKYPLEVGHRVWAIGGGVACAGYGFLVAAQTSGTWYFSPLVFLIPVVGIIMVIAEYRRRGLSTTDTGAGVDAMRSARLPGGSSPLAPAAPGLETEGGDFDAGGTLASAPAVESATCPHCGGPVAPEYAKRGEYRTLVGARLGASVSATPVTPDHDGPGLALEQGAAGSEPLRSLLGDPEVAAKARELKRVYGPSVCASFLTSKASELGLGELVFTAEDLPTDL